MKRKDNTNSRDVGFVEDQLHAGFDYKPIKVSIGVSPQQALAAHLAQLPPRKCYHGATMQPDPSSSSIERSMDSFMKIHMSIQTMRDTFGDPAQVHIAKVAYRHCRRCLLAHIGVPPLFQACRFENFEANTDEFRANLAKCREFVSATRGFLVMLGSLGAGKTHLAASILYETNLPSSRYLTHSDVIRLYRGTYQTRKFDYVEDNVIEDCRQAPLLVLDEIGVAPGGRDADVLLYDLIDYRYSNYGKTILCSNHPTAEFKGIISERLADRIRQARFALLQFNAPSRRTGENRGYFES